MHTIKLNDYSYLLAGSWEELEEREVQAVMRWQPSAVTVPEALWPALLRAESEEGERALPGLLQPVVVHELKKLCAWLHHPEQIKGYLLRRLVQQDGTVLYPPQATLADMTWTEFCYADTAAQQGRRLQLAAVLYRPLRKEADPDLPPRTPFTPYGMQHRYSQLRAVVGEEDLLAVSLSYLAIRQREVRRWPRLFPSASKVAPPPDGVTLNLDEEREREGKGRQASWADITARLLTDAPYMADALGRQPADAVLQNLELRLGND